MQEAAQSTIHIDNERVRVTEWRFTPGAATGYHRHLYDYVVVPLSTGTLLLKTPDGDHEARLTTGTPYFRNAGVEHDVINISACEIAFMEIEIK